jgi:hypothetical protein
MKTGEQLLKDATLRWDEEPKLKDEPLPNTYTPQSMEVVRTFGKWTVDKKGNMEYDKGRYYIEHERLHEDDWVCHLFEKGWIDWNEFIPAFFTACKLNKIEFVRLRVFYKSALKQ